jgi:hypothetical protein
VVKAKEQVVAIPRQIVIGLEAIGLVVFGGRY